MIFQTEKQLKEYGDKLSEGNKTAISAALETLKKAHEAKDLAAIDPAIEGLNKAWEAASQEIYNATQGAQGGAQPGADGGAGAGASSASGDDVSDVEFEEVEEEK